MKYSIHGVQSKTTQNNCMAFFKAYICLYHLYPFWLDQNRPFRVFCFGRPGTASLAFWDPDLLGARPQPLEIIIRAAKQLDLRLGEAWGDFSPDRWRSRFHHLKRLLKHPKKVTKNCQGHVFGNITAFCFRALRVYSESLIPVL